MPPLERVLLSAKLFREHPLTRDGGQAAAWTRWLRWQIGSRIAPGQVALPFAVRSRLLASPSTHGATSNYYCGLGEFGDMGFVLHFLRPDDLFLDIGANIGSFTVLAAGEVGCQAVAFEPAPETFAQLQANVGLNNLEDRVACHQKAVGSEPGTVQFTAGLDSLNHIVARNESATSQSVEVVRLDDFPLARIPRMVKIDTEGFEAAVLEGGRKLFGNPALEALTVEISYCERYGIESAAVFDAFLGLGLTPCEYDPLERKLTPQAKPYRFSQSHGNSLFVRNPDSVQERCRSARRWRILGCDI